VVVVGQVRFEKTEHGDGDGACFEEREDNAESTREPRGFDARCSKSCQGRGAFFLKDHMIFFSERHFARRRLSADGMHGGVRLRQRRVPQPSCIRANAAFARPPHPFPRARGAVARHPCRSGLRSRRERHASRPSPRRRRNLPEPQGKDAMNHEPSWAGIALRMGLE
jgi:hypothetical protein